MTERAWLAGQPHERRGSVGRFGGRVSGAIGSAARVRSRLVVESSPSQCDSSSQPMGRVTVLLIPVMMLKNTMDWVWKWDRTPDMVFHVPRHRFPALMDTLTKKERSEVMSRVRHRDTKPEWAVRRLVHRFGYRYRLHARHLPGKPDLVFGPKRKAIFVHGCFWHRHPRCKLARLPKSRRDFWIPKLEANRERDLRNQQELRALGWAFVVVWECEIKDTKTLERRLKSFLGEFAGVHTC